MFGLTIFLVLVFINNVVNQDLISPCPRLFEYEPRNPNEPDKIYGVLILRSDADLHGVYLRVIFDKPSLQLGNWFGIILTDDNIVYKIQAPSKKLLANVPIRVRFYIKYDTSQPPPKLIEYRLNAKTVCPEGIKPTTEAVASAEYFTSPEISTTIRPRPLQASVPASYIENFYEPIGLSTDEEDGIFIGDLSVIQRPRENRPYTEKQCGIVTKSPLPLITHGQSSSEGQYPWQAALYHVRGADLSYRCGATLISKTHLITVAHCVTRERTQTMVSPSSLIVYLGKCYLKVWSNPGIQDRQIEKIIVHEEYNSSTLANNIAILKLTESVDITSYVRPVCLWEENTSLESVITRQGIVVGWGSDATGRLSEQLRKASMHVVSRITCVYSNPEFYSRFTSDHTYCSGYQNGTSVCNGDSGAGMVFPKTGSYVGNPIWQLRGMVSLGVMLQNKFSCDPSHYVVFTDVAMYLDWIKNVLNF